MRRTESGWALASVLFLIAVCATAAGVVWLRLSVDQMSQRSRDARAELLWLARSAVVHPPARSTTITVAGMGAVSVEVTRKRAQSREVIAEASSLRFGTARVAARISGARVISWRESFDASGRSAEPPPAP